MMLFRNVLFGAIICIAVFACQTNSTTKNNAFKLSGAVDGTADTTAFFKLRDSTYSINVVNDSFRLELPLEQNSIGQFSIGLTKLKVFAKPNEDLFISISDNSVTYDGSLAELHEEIASVKEDHIEQPQYSNLRALYSLPQDSFNILVFNTSDHISNALDTIVREDTTKWNLRIWDALTHQLAMYALNYPLYHGRLTNNDTFEVSPQYFTKVKDHFRLEDQDLLLSQERKDILMNFVEVQVRLDTPSVASDSVRLKLLFEKAEESFDRDTLVNVIITQLIKDQVKYQGLGDADSLITAYVAKMPDSKVKDEINERISKWKQLKEGKKAPDFTAQRVDSSKVSLNDLKGKVVYIDVWATWCGPCLREIPHLEKMYERYEDREDVALVSVSIDSDYDKWYNKVTEDEMGGIQLWIEDAWNSKLNEDYLINSIPRFILIDKQGKIVDADAPRPSSGEKIYSMIDSEL